jgi:hypothetical protein
MLVGCAASRRLRAAGELAGCSEESTAEVARPSAQIHWAAEKAPELTWYRGCGSTVVCLEDAQCFATQRPAPRAGEAPSVFRLPGLTPEETVLHAALAGEVVRLQAQGDPGETLGCAWEWYLFGPVAWPVVLIAQGAGGCFEDREENSQAARQKNLRAQIEAIEARLHPLASSGCTEEERHQLDLGLVLRTTASVCSTSTGANVQVDTPPPRTPLRARSQ